MCHPEVLRGVRAGSSEYLGITVADLYRSKSPSCPTIRPACCAKLARIYNSNCRRFIKEGSQWTPNGLRSY